MPSPQALAARAKAKAKGGKGKGRGKGHDKNGRKGYGKQNGKKDSDSTKCPRSDSNSKCNLLNKEAEQDKCSDADLKRRSLKEEVEKDGDSKRIA